MIDGDEVGEICGYGINGATGEYLTTPRAETLTDDLIAPARHAAERKHELHWGVLDGDPSDLSEVGWGLILLDPEGDPREAEVRERNENIAEALRPLLLARQAEAGDKFKVMLAKRGDSRSSFLARYGLGEGQLDTRVVPYYSLIVASPDELEFGLQCSLDVQGAIGRLWFEPTVADKLDADSLHALCTYAVAHERGQVAPRTRHADFFGVANDLATISSSNELVKPVFEALDAKRLGWTKSNWLGDAASRTEMLSRFVGTTPVGFVFTATHGVAYPKDDPLQRTLQGSLVCNEWRGNAPPTREEMIAAGDIPQTANLSGTVFFLFACYGVGTPRSSDFVHLDRRQQRFELSDRARIAPLAQRLLERGAPVVIGHVERAWSWSYGGPQLRELGHFEAAIKGILGGRRVGAALEPFGQRYADAAVTLTTALEERATTVPQPRRIARLWTKVNDARGYALLGDPALRLCDA